MDLQLNRRRPGSGTGPVFRSGVNIPNVSKLRQMPQPQRMMAQMVQTVSSKNEFTDSNIPFLVEQINVRFQRNDLCAFLGYILFSHHFYDVFMFCKFPCCIIYSF